MSIKALQTVNEITLLAQPNWNASCSRTTVHPGAQLQKQQKSIQDERDSLFLVKNVESPHRSLCRSDGFTPS